MTEPGALLHEDDPQAEVVMPDGRVVRNLSAEEYAATYATGTVHDERPGSPPEPNLAGVDDEDA